MEFYHTAVKLRVMLTEWLLRDFGIKRKVRQASAVAKSCRMEAQDAEQFLALLEKYALTNTLAEDYPSWWLIERRRTIDRICATMMQNIRAANSIRVTTEAEYHERRILQDRAIGNADQLLEELQYVIAVLHRTLGVDVDKYLPFADLIQKEILLLKGWRKSGNRKLTELRQRKSKG